ncbi:MAG: hypothetical protein WCL39_05245 [Armatimonadota bacterium]
MMNQSRKTMVFGLTTALAMFVCAGAFQAASLRVTTAEGWVIFDPSLKNESYRYGPSIIINKDKSIDIWFASPGGQGEDGTGQWDWIRHKRSVDGGKSWGTESVVLKPTEKSFDQMSVCDPGVIRFGGFYYLGVTAVDNGPGVRNQIFVARSKSPTGPYEKWNGAGWGQNPVPLIAFTEPKDSWGAGEPSFVIKGADLFIYYTWLVNVNPGGATLAQTRVAVAPARDPNWPGKLTHKGLVWERIEGEDSADVKYIPEYKTFIALSTASRMGPQAHVVYRTSEDGVRWSKPSTLYTNVLPWCHNAGISARENGQIDLNDHNFISYAYSRDAGVNWGFWHTLLNPIAIIRSSD